MRFNPFTLEIDHTTSQRQSLELFLGFPCNWTFLLEWLFRSVGSADVNFLDFLVGMDVAYLGQPFIEGATKTTTNLQLMDVAYLGQPFVAYRRAS